MTEPTERAQALTAAAKMTSALRDVWAELKKLNAYTHRTRHIVWAVIFSLVIDLGLTGWVYHVARQESATSAVAQAIHASQIGACETGNRIRAQQHGVWSYLIKISPPPPRETPSERQARLLVLRKFERYIGRAYAPIDCQKLYRLTPGATLKPTMSPSALPPLIRKGIANRPRTGGYKGG